MTEMIQSEEDGAEKGASEKDITEKDTTERALPYVERAQRGEQPTLRTSQGAQVRGYLESIADSDFVRELQKALAHAHQLTGDAWRVEVSAEGVEIFSDPALDEVETSLDSVLELASDSVAASYAEPARIKLPAPQRPKPKPEAKREEGPEAEAELKKTSN